MKKNILLPVLTMLLVLCCSACTVIREQPSVQVSQEVTTPEHKKCRDFLMCFLKNDASGFISHLSPESAQDFDVAKFRRTRDAVVKSLGEPVSFRYLTTLEFVSLKPHVWAVRFRRKSKDGQEFFSEALFRVVTGRTPDGNILIIGFNFL